MRPGGLVSLINQLFRLLQLDQLVVDAAKEKRDMEQKHSTIQQKVCSHKMVSSSLKKKYTKHINMHVVSRCTHYKRTYSGVRL